MWKREVLLFNLSRCSGSTLQGKVYEPGACSPYPPGTAHEWPCKGTRKLG